MSGRTRIWILTAANGLLLVALVAGLLAPARGRSLSRPLVPAAALEATELRLVAGARSIRLERNGTWEVIVDERRFPARFDRIELFLDGMRRSRVVRRVTDDPALHERLGVSDAAGRVVTIGAARGSWSFVFGESADAPGRIAVRVSGDDTVWLAETNADFYLRQTPSFWAYLRLFPERAEPRDMVRARVEIGDTEAIELVRDAADEWSIVAGEPVSRADPNAVESLARRLVDLVGSGYFEGSFAALEQVGRFSFSLADGRTFGAEIGYDGSVYVARPWGPDLPGEPYGGLTYTLEPATFRRLTPELSALLATARRTRSAA